MTGWTDYPADDKGRQIHPVLFNTAKDGSGTWYFALVDSDGQLVLGAGTATIGKLGANSGVDIGDVDVTSLIPGVAATHLGKAEDAAHTSGDTGVQTLEVRKDVAGSSGSTDGDYVYGQQDQDGNKRVVAANPMFGQPTLIAVNNSKATWEKGKFDTPTWQKGTTGWVANLFGGLQTGYNDFAAVYVPVNEMHVPDLTSALWTWYQTATEAIGMNMVVWVHNPEDNDKRAELTQTNWTAGIDKSAGWNSHELNLATGQWTLGGEGTAGTGLSGDDNTWVEVAADVIIGTWTIYRISFEWGYYTGDVVLQSAYVADIKINGTVILVKPSLEEQLDIVRDDQAKALTTIPTWTFGEPFLRHSVAGEATWSRWHHQKGAHGWTAKLYGGVQTSYNDWARVAIPVNEMPINDLKSALWTWNNTEEEANGLGMVIYIHDPADNDLRVEMTQLAAHADIEKGAGWLAHELNVATDYFYWYGEDGDTAGDLTEGVPNYYGLDDFQADKLFGKWTIYRIDFYWGAQTGSEEYKDVWVADIKINGIAIPIKPDSSGTGRIGRKFYTGSGNLASGAALLAPKTPYRLLSISMHLDGQQTSASSFVVSLLSEQGTNFDPAILTDDMDVPAGKVSLYAPFGQGYEFGMDDELDLVYTNGGTKTYGLTYTYEVLG